MNLSEKDRKYIWHPYTQHKSDGFPIPIVRGEGVYLIDENGKKYIDAISSWWVNLHGHCHPYIAEKLAEQFNILDHVIFAGVTHPKAIELSERLLGKLPGNQNKLFFSDNGSTAVEVALKMAFQYWYNAGKHRTKVIALEGAYHGDTFGAMSAGSRGVFSKPFSTLLFDVIHIPFPVEGKEQITIDALKNEIKNKEPACFIFEPLIQGASGMRMYSAGALDALTGLCKENNVITIADEVMTGFFRTGKFLACEYLKNKPDIICLSKGITGGVMALGTTSCTDEIFSAFLSDDRHKTLFHGHSYTANPLACAAACASLDLLEKQETQYAISRIAEQQSAYAAGIVKHNRGYEEVRCTGTVIALDIKSEERTSYFNKSGKKMYSYFIERGILLRPLGNTLYVMPPYCITKEELVYVYESINTMGFTI